MTTTIGISYVAGTDAMLECTLSGVLRFTKDYNIVVGCREGHDDNGLKRLKKEYGFDICVTPEKEIKKGWEHGSILNYMVEEWVEGDFFCTLDSDCIPVASGWLDGLINQFDSNVITTGILHPWIPPKTKDKSIAYRIRRQHCYDVTHVACQVISVENPLIRLRKVKGISFVSGDDTSLGIVDFFREKGMVCKGYMPTGCPHPSVPFDSEFNRYTCVLYGDKVLHVGGHSRMKGDEENIVFGKAFGWAIDKIIKEKDASWILNDYYAFKFDKEEEVAQEHVQRATGLHKDRMIV